MEFAGRQIDGHKVDAARIARYIRYASIMGSSRRPSERDSVLSGLVVATPGVLEAFRASGDDPIGYLVRHIAGDWGDVDEHDRRENELSLQHGWHLLSAYTLSTGVKIWIITEADRSVTTFLLPEEY